MVAIFKEAFEFIDEGRKSGELRLLSTELPAQLHLLNKQLLQLCCLECAHHLEVFCMWVNDVILALHK